MKGSTEKFSRARFLYPDLSIQLKKDQEEKVTQNLPDATEEASAD